MFGFLSRCIYFTSDTHWACYSDVSLKVLLVCGKHLKCMESNGDIRKNSLERCGHFKWSIFIV